MILSAIFLCNKYHDFNLRNKSLLMGIKAVENLNDGNLTESIALFNQAIALYPDSLIYEDLGDLYLVKSEEKLALKLYKQSIAVQSSLGATPNEVLLAKIEILQSRLEKHSTSTSHNYRKLIDRLENRALGNDSYTDYLLVGKLYLAGGEKDKALLFLTKAKDAYEIQYKKPSKSLNKIFLEIAHLPMAK
jgi:tetratricopeptide (TPR) repeat protein